MDKLVRKAVPNAVGRSERKPGEYADEQYRAPAATKSDFRTEPRDDPGSQQSREDVSDEFLAQHLRYALTGMGNDQQARRARYISFVYRLHFIRVILFFLGWHVREDVNSMLLTARFQLIDEIRAL